MATWLIIVVAVASAIGGLLARNVVEIVRMTVRRFQQTATARELTERQLCEACGGYCNGDLDKCFEIMDARVEIDVNGFESQHACPVCNSTTRATNNESLVYCTKCEEFQRPDDDYFVPISDTRTGMAKISD